MWRVETMLSFVDRAGRGGGNLNINLRDQTLKQSENTTGEVSTKSLPFHVTGLKLGTWVDTQLNFLIPSQ